MQAGHTYVHSSNAVIALRDNETGEPTLASLIPTVQRINDLKSSQAR